MLRLITGLGLLNPFYDCRAVIFTLRRCWGYLELGFVDVTNSQEFGGMGGSEQFGGLRYKVLVLLSPRIFCRFSVPDQIHCR